MFQQKKYIYFDKPCILRGWIISFSPSKRKINKKIIKRITVKKYKREREIDTNE
jgi:hypothetical protein